MDQQAHRVSLAYAVLDLLGARFAMHYAAPRTGIVEHSATNSPFRKGDRGDLLRHQFCQPGHDVLGQQAHGVFPAGLVVHVIVD